MLKKTILFSVLLTSHALSAATTIDLYQAPLSSINKYLATPKQNKMLSAKTVTAPENNSLKQVNQTQEENAMITRYQQFYKGIPVVGAQVMVIKSSHSSISAQDNSQVNGQLIDDIQVKTQPAFSASEAIDLAKKSYFRTNLPLQAQQESAQLQIRPTKENQLKLVYLVSFKGITAENKPVWPFFVIDAQTGDITQQWNNITTYLDNGPGGNEKIHKYWYGKNGLPALDVAQNGTNCVMESTKVKLVDVGSFWDWSHSAVKPAQYLCGNNVEENVNGGFSPRNDAYFFGHIIVDMYQQWYGLNALQQSDGTPMKLIMRVHFGEAYDNAFWDGQSMSFGDGNAFYPLVSLDVAGHEVTHGFTEQHSGLEYHDQSGALNEALSDMAGQTARAYLLETIPQLYNKAYLQPNEVTWGIGETITKKAMGKALRFMDFPSSDGSSADCVDKDLAQSRGAYCAINYDELINYANSAIADPQQRQGYIVHTASGIFNKAFYLLSKNIGIKDAYHVMIIANTKYWTPTTDFSTGACGVLRAANDLSVDISMVKNVFEQVGIDTNGCSII